MNEIDQRLAGLAAQQHGPFSREQARDAGLSTSALAKRIKRCDLVVCGTYALRLPGPELSWYGQLTAGLLDLGSAAIVTGLAAAQLHGLEGFDGNELAYLLPWEQRGRSTIGQVITSADINRLDWE